MKNSIALMSGACLCLSLTACVDNNYDLSDVDTTVKVPVKNLTVPVNIDPIKLDNILDLEDDSPVKIINGEYVISEDGDFESTDIKVEDVDLGSPKLESSETLITLAGASSPTATMPDEIKYELSSEERSLNLESQFVSSNITAVDELGCNLSMKMNVSIDDLKGIVSNIDFKNLKLQLSKGLEGVKVDNSPEASYNSETGVLSIPMLRSTGHALTLVVHAAAIDFKYLNSIGSASFTPAASEDLKGAISMSGDFYMISGEAVILDDYIAAGSASIPTQATLKVDYDISTVKVNQFSGDIYYSIDDMDIPNVELSNMPDFLSNESTVIGLQNPQIYLTITNPLYKYSLSAVTGLKITAIRNGKEDKSFTLDSDIVLDPAKSTDGVFLFCLSPVDPAQKVAGYENAQWLKYSDLGMVVAGDGLPESLKIELIDPRVPNQTVNKFDLGEPVGTVTGDYEFMAPLGVTKGSKIVYSDVADGWQSEDLDCVTIEELIINLSASTDLPIEVTLTGYPINTAGERIVDASGNPLSVEGAYIPALAQNHKATIHITGVIPENSHLDGIRFEAVCNVPVDNSAVLSPEMTITLKDIRPTVSGYYVKEL